MQASECWMSLRADRIQKEQGVAGGGVLARQLRINWANHLTRLLDRTNPSVAPAAGSVGTGSLLVRRAERTNDARDLKSYRAAEGIGKARAATVGSAKESLTRHTAEPICANR
jgi:hypothetical protein